MPRGRTLLVAQRSSVALFFLVATAGANPDEPTAPAPSVDRATITFDEAVEIALERNASTRIAAHEIARAQALVEQSRAASLPTLSANGQYTRLDGDRMNQGRIIASKDQLSGNISLAVPLLAPSRWVAWRHVKDNVELARGNAADIRRTVASLTAHAYLTVISQGRLVEINTHAMATAKAHFDYAHTRYAGGIGTRIDEVRAEQEYAAELAQLEASRLGEVRAREALSVLVGSHTLAQISDKFDLPSAPTQPQGTEDAVTRRTDIQLAQARLRAAERVAKDAWADYLPTLLGQVQPFVQHPESFIQPTVGWQAQLILSLPLYDGGLRYGVQDERVALRTEAEAHLDGAIAQAESDVRLAYEGIRRIDAQLTAARQASELAKQSLELANTAYKAGATTNLEVIDAERRERDAASAAVQAEDASHQARLDLLVATGRFPPSPAAASRATPR